MNVYFAYMIAYDCICIPIPNVHVNEDARVYINECANVYVYAISVHYFSGGPGCERAHQ